jgi:hypothetical protein
LSTYINKIERNEIEKFNRKHYKTTKQQEYRRLKKLKHKDDNETSQKTGIFDDSYSGLDDENSLLAPSKLQEVETESGKQFFDDDIINDDVDQSYMRGDHHNHHNPF